MKKDFILVIEKTARESLCIKNIDMRELEQIKKRVEKKLPKSHVIIFPMEWSE